MMRTRLSVCATKVAYRSLEEAQGVAERTGWQLRSYRCDRCRRFHLTSRTRGKRRPRPAEG